MLCCSKPEEDASIERASPEKNKGQIKSDLMGKNPEKKKTIREGRMNFVMSFDEELKRNKKIWKELISQISYSNTLAENKVLKLVPLKSIEQESRKLPGQKIDVDQLIHMYQEPYHLSITYFRQCKYIIVETHYFLKKLQSVITLGYRPDDDSGEYEKRKEKFKREGSVIVQMVEKLIQGVKDIGKKQRSKIMEQNSDNLQLQENQNLKVNLEQLQKRLEQLEDIIKKLQNQRDTYVKLTIPNLKSQIVKLKETLIVKQTPEQIDLTRQDQTKTSKLKTEFEERQRRIFELQQIIGSLKAENKELIEKDKFNQKLLDVYRAKEEISQNSFDMNNTKSTEITHDPHSISYSADSILTKENLQDLNSTVTKQKIMIQRLQYQNNQLKGDLQELNQKSKSQIEDGKQLNRQVERSQKDLIRQLESNINQLNRVNKDLNQQMKKQNKKEVSKEDISGLQTTKRQLQRTKKILDDKQMIISSCKQELVSIRMDLNNKSLELNQNHKNFRQLQKQLTIQSLQHNQLKELNITLANKLDQFKQSKSRYRSQSFVQHNTLFIGDILESKKLEKRFLINQISNHQKKTIEKSKILYEFKKDQKNNFHHHIDGHSNLVTIIETVQGALIAGYYSGVFSQKITMTEEALILSLNNYHCYPLNTFQNNPKRQKKDKKVMHGMVYDKFFLIYGNSQLRLKNGQKKFFSNFGINNGFFINKGDTVNAIIGMGKTNEVEVINYEVHQIFFQEEYEHEHI